MKKIIALFLIFSIIGLYGNLYANERRGAIVEIYKTKPKTKMEGTPWETPDIKGELIAVKENSLLLLDSRGADSSVDINELYAIRIVKKSKALIGFGIGFVAPAAVLAAMGANIDGLYALYSVIMGFPSAVLGAIIGGRLSRDNTYQIAGKSDAEIKKILEDLRKKARVPNFQ
jgi:hypothetical protein